MGISELLDNIRLLFVTEKKPFLQLKAILGFLPHNIRLYELALKHKSVTYYEQDHGKKKHKHEEGVKVRHLPSTFYTNNERLEFLGDAVLGAIVADILYKHYGNKQEGFLTNLRSKIVCRSSLNKLAVDMGLDTLIQYAGFATTAHNSFMRGNAFEAFLGAIYLDRGYDYCYRFLEKKVFKYYISIDEVERMEKNFKSLLIEWCQKRQYAFEFCQEEMRDEKNHHVPMFHSSVLIEGIPSGTGDGYSKKESDQAAARQALARLKANRDLYNGIKKASLSKRGNPS